MELYALSVLDVQMVEKQGTVEEGKMNHNHTDSGVCITLANVNHVLRSPF